MKAIKFNNARIIALLSLTGLAVVSQLYLSIPLFATISRLFNVSVASASWLGSAFGFAYASGFLLFGPMSDRYGRRTVMTTALPVLILATFAIGLSPSFEVLIILRVLQGLAAAPIPIAALAYLGEVLPVPRRATGIAFMTMGFLLAGILGQIYADAINRIFGWQWVFWNLAAFYILLLILIRQIPQAALLNKSKTNILSVYANMMRLLSNPEIVAAYIATLPLLLTFVSMYVGLSRSLQLTYGSSNEHLLLVRLAGIPGMLLSPFVGRLVTRFGSKRVVIGGLVVAALGLSLEPLTNQLSLIAIASGIFVMGIAAAVPSLINLISSIAGTARGAAVSLYSFILFIGASLGPIVATQLQPLGFAGLCSVLVFSLVLAMIVITVGVRTTLQKTTVQETPKV